jgi:hypothetical protein
MASEIVDTIYPGKGGIDFDTDLLFILKGYSRNRQNAISTDDGLYGSVSRLKGNTYKDNSGSFTYPSGTTIKVLGFKENKEDRSGVFFIYSSSGNHSIVKYDYPNDSLVYILDGSMNSGVGGVTVGDILDFDSDYFIDLTFVGNQDETFLTWVDKRKEPRLINVNMAINFTAGSGTPAYTEITDDAIRFYKKPLLTSIGTAYANNVLGINNLKGNLWQFAIRAKFYDNTYSTLSQYTDVPIPNYEEIADGLYTSVFRNSEIIIGFTDPNRDEVEEYQLLYRQVDLGSGAVGDWYLSDVKQRDAGFGVTQFLFTNSEGGVIVSVTDTDRPQDFVPDLADHVGAINSNQIIFGGITEGNDNMDLSDIDITLTTSRQAISGKGVVTAITDTQTILDSASYDFDLTKATSDDYHYLVVITGLATGSNFITVPTSYERTTAQVCDELVVLINDATITGITASNVSDDLRIANSSGNSVDATVYVLETYEKHPSFPSGSRQFFGLQYFRNGKPFFIQGNADSDDNENDFIVNIPYLHQATPTYTLLNFYHEVDWVIAHLPPEGATHYQWAWLGSDIDYSETYLMRARATNPDVTFDGDYMLIDKTIVDNFKEAYQDGVNYGFAVQAGDKLRILGYFDASTILSSSLFDDVYLLEDLYEYDILSVDSTHYKIKSPGQALFDDLDGSSYDHGLFLIQIYRPKQISSSQGFYQAISPLYDIYEDSGIMYHRGGSQDQDSGNDAEGTFDPYFANAIMRRDAFVNANNQTSMGTPLCYSWVEGFSVSLLYDSNVQFHGKQNIINSFAKRDYFNKMRFGQKYLDESGVNFITRFNYEDERALDDRNGRVTKIEQVGDVLKIYQEKKMTSFYLGAVTSTDASGNQQVVFSDVNVSDIRQSTSRYGCTHFTSYALSPNHEFFFDIINAVVIKATKGGLIPISEQGNESGTNIKSYLRDKISEIETYGVDNVNILGVYDDFLDMYLLSFVVPSDHAHAINETIGFNDRQGKWEGFFSWIPEYYGYISGGTAITFKDGLLYLQNSNAIRGQFFGTKYESIVEVVSNEAPDQNKIYKAIEIVSDGAQWAPSENGDVEIPFPELMQSRLVTGKFDYEEGVWLSDFLANALDGSGTFVRGNLYTGSLLRGRYNVVTLRCNSDDASDLKIVIIKSDISR